MQGSSLLQLVQTVLNELGLPQTSFVINAADNTSRQIGALASRIGQMLTRSFDWSFLIREFHIVVPMPITTTGNLTMNSMVITNLPSSVMASLLPSRMVVSGAADVPGTAATSGIMTSTRLVSIDTTHFTATLDQPVSQTGTAVPLLFRQDTFPKPADFLRSINRTHWDRSMRWELRGPQSPQEAQWVRSGIVSTGPRRMYREINSAYRIWPPPVGGQDTPAALNAEYIGNSWVWNSGGGGANKFQNDSDTCSFADDLMTMGMKYLFFHAKGFEYTKLQDDFERDVRNAMSDDGGAQTLNLTRTAWPIFLSPSNVQDGSFPGTFGNP
jgi:hypothetical protein